MGKIRRLQPAGLSEHDDDIVIRPYSRTTVTWENEDSEIMKDVFSGDKTMEEACKAMADQMNECLADEQ